MTFEDFRYEHKRLYRTLVAIVVALIALSVFMALPRSSLFTAIGVNAMQDKVAAFKNALYWQTRVAMHKNERLTSRVFYGNMLGVTKQGGVLVNIAIGDKYERHIINMADIRITNPTGVAAIVGALRDEDVKLEFFGTNAVIWVRGDPLNLSFIDMGHARPDPTPPTNIIDRVFAAYYWRLFKDGRNELDGDPAAKAL